MSLSKKGPLQEFENKLKKKVKADQQQRQQRLASYERASKLRHTLEPNEPKPFQYSKKPIANLNLNRPTEAKRGRPASSSSKNSQMQMLLSCVNFYLKSTNDLFRFVDKTRTDAYQAMKVYKEDRFNLEDIIQNQVINSREGEWANIALLQNNNLKKQNSELNKERLLLQAQIALLKEDKRLSHRKEDYVSTTRWKTEYLQSQNAKLKKFIRNIGTQQAAQYIRLLQRESQKISSLGGELTKQQKRLIEGELSSMIQSENRLMEEIRDRAKHRQKQKNNEEIKYLTFKKLVQKQLIGICSMIKIEFKADAEIDCLQTISKYIVRVLKQQSSLSSEQTKSKLRKSEMMLLKKEQKLKQMQNYITDLENQKVSLYNQLQIQKIQAGERDNLQQVYQHNQQLKQSFEQIFIDLKEACLKGNLIQQGIENICFDVVFQAVLNCAQNSKKTKAEEKLLRAQNKKLTNQLSKLSQSISETQTQIIFLQKQNLKLQGQIVQLTSLLQNERNSFKSKVQFKSNESKQNFDKINKLLKEKQKLALQNLRLQNHLREQYQQSKRLKQRLVIEQTHIQRIQQQKDKLFKKQREAEKHTQELTIQLRITNDQVRILTDKLQKAVAQQKQLKDEIAFIQGGLSLRQKEMKVAIEQVKKECTLTISQINKTSKQQLKQIKDQHHKQINLKLKEIRSIQEQKDKLALQLDVNKRKYLQQQKYIGSMSSQISSLKQLNQIAQLQLKDINQLNKIINNKLIEQSLKLVELNKQITEKNIDIQQLQQKLLAVLKMNQQPQQNFNNKLRSLHLILQNWSQQVGCSQKTEIQQLLESIKIRINMNNESYQHQINDLSQKFEQLLLLKNKADQQLSNCKQDNKLKYRQQQQKIIVLQQRVNYVENEFQELKIKFDRECKDHNCTKQQSLNRFRTNQQLNLQMHTLIIQLDEYKQKSKLLKQEILKESQQINVLRSDTQQQQNLLKMKHQQQIRNLVIQYERRLDTTTNQIQQVKISLEQKENEYIKLLQKKNSIQQNYKNNKILQLIAMEQLRNQYQKEVDSWKGNFNNYKFQTENQIKLLKQAQVQYRTALQNMKMSKYKDQKEIDQKRVKIGQLEQKIQQMQEKQMKNSVKLQQMIKQQAQKNTQKLSLEVKVSQLELILQNKAQTFNQQITVIQQLKQQAQRNLSMKENIQFNFTLQQQFSIAELNRKDKQQISIQTQNVTNINQTQTECFLSSNITHILSLNLCTDKAQTITEEKGLNTDIQNQLMHIQLQTQIQSNQIQMQTQTNSSEIQFQTQRILTIQTELQTQFTYEAQDQKSSVNYMSFIRIPDLIILGEKESQIGKKEQQIGLKQAQLQTDYIKLQEANLQTEAICVQFETLLQTNQSQTQPMVAPEQQITTLRLTEKGAEIQVGQLDRLKLEVHEWQYKYREINEVYNLKNQNYKQLFKVLIKKLWQEHSQAQQQQQNFQDMLLSTVRKVAQVELTDRTHRIEPDGGQFADNSSQIIKNISGYFSANLPKSEQQSAFFEKRAKSAQLGIHQQIERLQEQKQQLYLYWCNYNRLALQLYRSSLAKPEKEINGFESELKQAKGEDQQQKQSCFSFSKGFRRAVDEMASDRVIIEAEQNRPVQLFGLMKQSLQLKENQINLSQNTVQSYQKKTQQLDQEFRMMDLTQSQELKSPKRLSSSNEGRSEPQPKRQQTQPAIETFGKEDLGAIQLEFQKQNSQVEDLDRFESAEKSKISIGQFQNQEASFDSSAIDHSEDQETNTDRLILTQLLAKENQYMQSSQKEFQQEISSTGRPDTQMQGLCLQSVQQLQQLLRVSVTRQEGYVEDKKRVEVVQTEQSAAREENSQTRKEVERPVQIGFEMFGGEREQQQCESSFVSDRVSLRDFGDNQEGDQSFESSVQESI